MWVPKTGTVALSVTDADPVPVPPWRNAKLISIADRFPEISGQRPAFASCHVG
jgi:hypothetical protein